MRNVLTLAVCAIEENRGVMVWIMALYSQSGCDILSRSYSGRPACLVLAEFTTTIFFCLFYHLEFWIYITNLEYYFIWQI